MSSLKLQLKRLSLYVYRNIATLLHPATRSTLLRGRINASDMQKVVDSNRANLARIGQWIPQGLLESSVFQYGILPEHQQILNLPLDRSTTHTDLLCYFARKLQKKPKYLELGVSIGKTFWQVMLSRPDIECWGFDIEEINPALREHLQLESREEWRPLSGSLRKDPSSISHFTNRDTGQKVVYICADIFDGRAWRLLESGQFNLILSDALHSPEALDYEWIQMTTGAVFNPNEVVILWDDLDGDMRRWFDRQASAISAELSIESRQVGTFFMNGWLGRREFPHRLGIALKHSAGSSLQ